jgi:hypothetical protein
VVDRLVVTAFPAAVGALGVECGLRGLFTLPGGVAGFCACGGIGVGREFVPGPLPRDWLA